MKSARTVVLPSTINENEAISLGAADRHHSWRALGRQRDRARWGAADFLPKIGHLALYPLLLAAPAVGVATLFAGGKALSIFGVAEIPSSFDRGDHPSLRVSGRYTQTHVAARNSPLMIALAFAEEKYCVFDRGPIARVAEIEAPRHLMTPAPNHDGPMR